ncbi:cytochrome c oxidase accessory factor, putative [Babesia ovis]|uniref:Cytochrome c oxidase accessory factor, putative n=1 Tax=Babesia ovis TaxID=5869 RepID=A0A9W5TA74_BABOV|nr:cytochrome c oxidase accessory factor, putative [Babesia ovis]
MFRIIPGLIYVAILLLGYGDCAHTSEMVLCADMCPSSTLVSPDGIGISKCFDTCKRLIHRVRYGDVLDSIATKEKVKAPKTNVLKRMRKEIGNVGPGKPKSTT